VRRGRALNLPLEEASRLGALDPAAIAQVAAQVFPEVREEEELYDVLLDLVLLLASEGRPWSAWMGRLVAACRAAGLAAPGPVDDTCGEPRESGGSPATVLSVRTRSSLDARVPVRYFWSSAVAIPRSTSPATSPPTSSAAPVAAAMGPALRIRELEAEGSEG
jgi:hypothetical protein